MATTATTGPLQVHKHAKRLTGQALLRDLVRAGLDPDALPAAAALIVALGELAREDADQRRARAIEGGRATQALRRSL